MSYANLGLGLPLKNWRPGRTGRSLVLGDLATGAEERQLPLSQGRPSPAPHPHWSRVTARRPAISGPLCMGPVTHFTHLRSCRHLGSQPLPSNIYHQYPLQPNVRVRKHLEPFYALYSSEFVLFGYDL